jgi:hypothetical protein
MSNGNSRSRKTKTFRKKSSQPKISFEKRVKKIAQEVCARDTETKMKVVNIVDDSPIKGAGLLDVGGAVGTPPGYAINNVLASIGMARGTDQETFIGNQIDHCNLQIRGFIQSRPYDSATNPSLLPYEVHMIIWKRKKNVTNNYDQLKQKMGNTTGAVTYELMNSLYPWNRDSYIIKKHRVFKMRPLAQVTSVSTDHNALANPQYSNAPAFQRFVQNIPISKKLIYADQNTTPSNDWVGVAFYIINGDGTNLTHGSNPSHRDRS